MSINNSFRKWLYFSILVFLVWISLGQYSAIAVIVGAACSSLAGFIGMYAATKANVRTAEASRKDNHLHVDSVGRCCFRSACDFTVGREERFYCHGFGRCWRFYSIDAAAVDWKP